MASNNELTADDLYGDMGDQFPAEGDSDPRLDEELVDDEGMEVDTKPTVSQTQAITYPSSVPQQQQSQASQSQHAPQPQAYQLQGQPFASHPNGPSFPPPQLGYGGGLPGVPSGPRGDGEAGGSGQDAVYLGDLNWWTTDEDIKAACEAAGLQGIKIEDVTFSEHKVNGKSKGMAFVDCHNAYNASRLVEYFGAVDFQGKRIRADLGSTAQGNPYKMLPKEPANKSAAYSNPGNRGRGGYNDRGGRGGFVPRGGGVARGGYNAGRGGGGGYNAGGMGGGMPGAGMGIVNPNMGMMMPNMMGMNPMMGMNMNPQMMQQMMASMQAGMGNGMGAQGMAPGRTPSASGSNGGDVDQFGRAKRS